MLSTFGAEGGGCLRALFSGYDARGAGVRRLPFSAGHGTIPLGGASVWIYLQAKRAAPRFMRETVRPVVKGGRFIMLCKRRSIRRCLALMIALVLPLVRGVCAGADFAFCRHARSNGTCLSEPA